MSLVLKIVLLSTLLSILNNIMLASVKRKYWAMIKISESVLVYLEKNYICCSCFSCCILFLKVIKVNRQNDTKLFFFCLLNITRNKIKIIISCPTEVKFQVHVYLHLICRLKFDEWFGDFNLITKFFSIPPFFGTNG